MLSHEKSEKITELVFDHLPAKYFILAKELQNLEEINQLAERLPDDYWKERYRRLRDTCSIAQRLPDVQNYNDFCKNVKCQNMIIAKETTPKGLMDKISGRFFKQKLRFHFSSRFSNNHYTVPPHLIHYKTFKISTGVFFPSFSTKFVYYPQNLSYFLIWKPIQCWKAYESR